MQFKNINLTFHDLFRDGPVISTEVNPAHEYKDGQCQDKVNGLKVSMVFPDNHYNTLTVTVTGPVDRLSTALGKGESVHVTFQGFTARPYVINNRGGVSSKVDGVQIVDDNDLIIA